KARARQKSVIGIVAERQVADRCQQTVGVVAVADRCRAGSLDALNAKVVVVGEAQRSGACAAASDGGQQGAVVAIRQISALRIGNLDELTRCGTVAVAIGASIDRQRAQSART